MYILYACMYVHMYVCSVCTYVCMYVHMYDLYICMYVCTYVYIRMCKYSIMFSMYIQYVRSVSTHVL